MKKNITDELNKAATFENNAPLYSEAELRALIENVPVLPPNDSTQPQPTPPSRWSLPRRITMISSAFVATAIVAYTIFPVGEEQPATNQQPTTKAVQQQSTTSTTPVESWQDSVVFPSRIEGIESLVLSDSELAQLGITKQDDGSFSVGTRLLVDWKSQKSLEAFLRNQENHQTQIHFNAEKLRSTLGKFGYDTTGASSVIEFRTQLWDNDIHNVLLTKEQTNEKRLAISPVLITQQVFTNGKVQSSVSLYGDPDVQGNVRKQMLELFDVYSMETANAKKKSNAFTLVNSLVPIRLKFGTEQYGSEIVLWYYPDSELQDALPPALRKYSQRTNGVGNAAEIEAQAGLAITSLGPNPARKQANMVVHSNQERSVQVALYDMNGRKIEVMGDVYSIANNGDVQIPLSFDVPSGAYLVAVVSNKGERVVSRLIIQE